MRIEPSTNQLGDFLGKIEAPKTEPLRPFEILSGKEDSILKQRRQQQLKQQEKQKAKQSKDVAEFNRPKTKTIQTKYGVFKVDIAGAWNPEIYAQIRQEIEDDQEKSNAPIDPKFANLSEIKTEVPVDINAETGRILGETFKALMPAPTRAVSNVVETAGKGVGEKGAELLESQNIYSQLAGLPLTIAGGIVTDVANPLAGFVTRTGNLYDPNATAEERIGAAGNIVGYALGAMNPLEAAGAGIKAFKAGATGTEALTTAGRALLRSSVPLGTKIDTALKNKANLKNLIDVLEKDPNVFVGVSRADLTKEFADAGKTFARETGKTAEEFYTKYLNDLADQAQPATPAQFDVTAPKASEAPAIPEPVINLDETSGKQQNVKLLYHGTTKKFTDFKLGPNRKQEQLSGLGVHFYEDYEPASRYAFDSEVARPGANPRVIEKNIDVGNTIDTRKVVSEDDPEWKYVEIALGKNHRFFTQDSKKIIYLQNAFDGAKNSKNLRNVLLEDGFDSILYDATVGTIDFRGIRNPSTSSAYIILDEARVNKPTAPKAPEAPTQIEDLGTVVDELVGKTEPVAAPLTIVEESDLEKLFQETVAPTLAPVKATRTRKPKAETVQPSPPTNEDLGAVVDELTTQVEPPIATPEPTAPVVEPPVIQEPEPIASATSVNTTPEELADPNVSVTQVPFKLDRKSVV